MADQQTDQTKERKSLGVVFPNVDKAKKILGFEAKTTLDASLDEIIPWIKDQIKLGEI